MLWTALVAALNVPKCALNSASLFLNLVTELFHILAKTFGGLTTAGGQSDGRDCKKQESEACDW